jgi:hypothetical protein
LRKELLGKSDWAEEKHVELGPPLSQRHCLDRPGPLRARVVNDCVEPASGRDSGPDNFHCRRDLTGIRHIQNDRLDGSHNPARPRLGQERLDIFLLSHRGQDAVTVFRQGKGCRAADSSRSAGDQDPAGGVC